MKSRIEKLKSIAAYVPVWIPSILILCAVLWLTLAPHPVGDMTVPLFPGADKLVHAIMFMTLCFAVLFDTMRSRHWNVVPLPLISAVVFATAALGVVIEYLQAFMDMGRSLELLDMAADFIGAVFGGVIWIIYQDLHLFVEDERHNDAGDGE